MNPRRLRVALAEDEALSRKRMQRLLQEAGCEVVATFAEGRGALDWLRLHPDLDGIFMDVHMPNLDGLAILRSLDTGVPVILTTAFPEHAVEAFDCEAADYLLKPVTASRLARALKRMEAKHSPVVSAPPPLPLTSRYPVHAGEGVVMVDLARTTHFEVENEVVWAHAGTRMRTMWSSLGEVEATFAGIGLLRVHRHLLVRPEAVIGLKSSAGGRAIVRMTGGVEIEASRGGAPRLRERLGL